MLDAAPKIVRFPAIVEAIANVIHTTMFWPVIPWRCR